MKLNGLLLFLLFFPCGVLAEGSFIISSFTAGSSGCRATDVCRSPDGSDTLIPLKFPISLNPGECILRKKINETECSLYKGILDTSAFSRTPPLYSFVHPGWARLEDLIKYRFFHVPGRNGGVDEEAVYFDRERIYIQHYDRLYYFRNDSWFDVTGIRGTPSGTLSINSTPPGARVSLNGIEQPQVTPCIIDRLIAGRYDVELFLPHHRFTAQPVVVIGGKTVEASFELISDMDTVYITGKAPYGVLILPQPPLDTTYKIDGAIAYSLRQRLAPGTHRISWNGGILYNRVDTMITVEKMKVYFLDTPFRRCYGTLKVIVYPRDAQVKIGEGTSRMGNQAVEIPTGAYRVVTERHGYHEVVRNVTVQPDSIVNLLIVLPPRPDRDRDGFPDTIDNCPDAYGLYDGCPKRRFKDAIGTKLDELNTYAANDSLELGFGMIGFISRIPARKPFANFLSTFSSGKTGGLNNYRGLTFVNSTHVMYRGFYGALELGQWSSGLTYRRDDTLRLVNNDGPVRYLVYYDSLAGVEPVLYIPSTTVALGFHFNWSWINVIYSMGYQWEDIILYDIIDEQTGAKTTAVFDNDFWFHQMHLEADLKADDVYVPGVYCKFKFPFSRTRHTSWHVMQAGLQLKFFPPASYRKKIGKKGK